MSTLHEQGARYRRPALLDDETARLLRQTYDSALSEVEAYSDVPEDAMPAAERDVAAHVLDSCGLGWIFDDEAETRAIIAWLTGQEA